MEDDVKVPTKYGEMYERTLEKKEYVFGRSLVTEYWFNGELVHRSCTVQLTGVSTQVDQQGFG